MKHLFTLLFICAYVLTWGQGVGTYEGFFKQEVDGAYFFFEVRNDSLLPSRKVIFKDVDVNKIKTGVFEDKGHNDAVSVFVLGIKSTEKISYKGLPYDEITVTDVKDTNGRLFWDFYSKNKERVIVPCMTGVFEGYFHNYYRGNVFLDKKYNYGKIDEYQSLISFKDMKQKELVLNLASQNDNNKCYYTDALIKVEGRMYYGNIVAYGYDIRCPFSLEVDRVLSVDKKKTYYDFLTHNLIKGYAVENDTLFPPNDFAIGKIYRYAGTAKDTLGVYEIEMLFTKKSLSTLKYTLKVVRNRNEKFVRYGNFTFTVPVYLPGDAKFNNGHKGTHYIYQDYKDSGRMYVAFTEGIKKHLGAASPPQIVLLDDVLSDISFYGVYDLELKLQN